LSSPENYSKGSLVERQIELQRASNQSASSHAEAFASHRRALTRLLVERAPASGEGRLCILGAGNGHDLDFPALARAYGELHLVDLDREALDAASARLPPEIRERLRLHAPVDLSGLLGRLEAWKRFEVTPDELMAFPDVVSRGVAATLQGPFDVVASTCLLTQMQLAVVETLSDSHRLFEAVRQFLNLAHLRTLIRLTAPAGHALLVSDLVSDQTYPLSELDPEGDHLDLLPELLRTGNLIYAVNPELIALTAREDPFLARFATLSPPLGAWLWMNGNERRFLVYALELTRRA
jgi:hypothetical protein